MSASQYKKSGNVHYLRSGDGGLDGGGGPPHNGDMEARVSKLETEVSATKTTINAIERDVAVIKSNYATKTDVAEAKNSIIMWVVSAILLAQVLPVLLKKFGA